MRIILGFTIFFCTLCCYSQERYILYLTDKEPLTDATLYFSKEAVKRKQQHNIPYTVADYPVNKNYIAALAHHGIKTILASKWLNAILVETSSRKSFDSFNFILRAEKLHEKPGPAATASTEILAVKETSDRNFILHNGKALYDHGLTGSNMHIAVFDAGFQGVDVIKGFEKLRNEGRIKYTRDVVNGNSVYAYDQHGTLVLSTMAGYKPGEFTGTAIDATYSLFVTENILSETKAEEFNWVVAAETADSLGVDVINSSLGYTEFDDSTTNYDRKDLDGETTIVARGAAIAASKGILVVNSAGNLRQEQWRTIVSPADADSIIAVGGVDINGIPAPFSSPGPSADGRIKPEVCSLGFEVALIDRDNNILLGNGTSFASPIIAGLAASLWQPLTGYNAQDIRQLILRSASRYQQPDNNCGYGIPDFNKAMVLAQLKEDQQNLDIYPNPAKENLYLSYGYLNGDIKAELINGLGQVISHIDYSNVSEYEDIDLSALLQQTVSPGIYVVSLETGVKKVRKKLVVL